MSDSFHPCQLYSVLLDIPTNLDKMPGMGKRLFLENYQNPANEVRTEELFAELNLKRGDCQLVCTGSRECFMKFNMRQSRKHGIGDGNCKLDHKLVIPGVDFCRHPEDKGNERRG